MLGNKILTLAFVRRHGEILLGYKKRGFGAGKWNGFGGKVEAGETIEDAAKRWIQKSVVMFCCFLLATCESCWLLQIPLLSSSCMCPFVYV